MKNVLVVLFAGVLVAASAMGDTFDLLSLNNGGQNGPNYPGWGMILWTSPGNGSVTLSGGAMATSSTDDVWLYYFPAGVFAYVTLPVNPPNVYSRTGATEIAQGTISGGGSCSGFVDYGSVNCIPLRQVSSLSGVPVQTGDVIAALIENMNQSANDNSATLDMNAQYSGDFQGSGSSGTQTVNGSYLGIAGSLDPHAGHTVDTYQFYWSTDGDLSGTALTDLVFGNGSSGGFQSGLELDLYNASGNLVGKTTVLGSSALSSTFDFGNLGAGNYTLSVIDLNTADDPPYEIEFNSPIEAGTSTVPEPNSVALFGAFMGGVLAIWQLARQLHRQA
jgi:hypothetical protein